MKPIIILLISVFLLSHQAKAQTQSLDKDLKVGLVLSGGGAKGFAHIGVLKVIDSLGIKIDYVAGTSMGAIIGGLYASGYSGKQLDSIFRNSDYESIISDKFNRATKSLHERDNSEKYIVTLPFEDIKLSLPSGLSRGQKVYNLLYQLMFHVKDVNEFKELPIPFFCIATNIETGESVTLDKGNLALAVSASGAFPSLFQPVVIDDSIFIDGGVTNNYPIEKLKEKGVDIIIGIDVQDNLENRDGLKSATDILFQINNFRAISDMKEKIIQTDIYIKPDITDFSVISFSEVGRIISNGEIATRHKLKDLISLRNKLKPVTNTKLKIAIKDSIIINNVKITGNENYTRSYVLGKLKLKDLGVIDYSTFNKCINSLVATNNFDAFNFELKKSKNKEGFDLVANIKEREITTFLKFGLHYDDLYKSAALINITQKRLFVDNDLASIDFIIGDNVRYNFEYFIDKGFYWSIGIKSRYNQFNKNINPEFLLSSDNPLLIGLNKIDIEIQDNTNQVYLQTIFGRDFSFLAGAEHKRLKIKSETLISDNQQDVVVFENTDYFSAFGSLKLDMYDNKYFPKNGVYFSGDFHWYLYASGLNKDFAPYSIAKADIGYAFNFGDKLAVNIISQGGFKIGNNSTKTLDFALGGYGNNFINNFYSFYGYDYISLTGNSFVKGTITLDYEIFKKHHITLAANYANIEDNLFDSVDWISVPKYSGYALGYGIETFLGPLEAKVTYSPEIKKSIWFFNFGFWF